MKRKIICAALFILSIICCLCAAACTKQPVTLEAPANIEVWGREITWDKVDGAQSYIVFFNGREYEVENNGYTLPDSTDAGEHTVEVLAAGNGKTTLDSEWSQQSFTLYDPVSHGYDEKGFEYTLLKDRSGYAISQGKISKQTYVHLELPDKYLGYPVKSIGEYGFIVSNRDFIRDEQTGENCNVLTRSVKFPSRLEKIGAHAFAYAIYLTEAEFPDTLTEIGYYAFSYCVRLSRVQFNEGLKIIGAGAFDSCAIEELILPQSLEKIGWSAFESYDTVHWEKYNINNFGPQKFTSVVIPENVKEIGDAAFALCTNLENITILSKHLDSIGSNIMGFVIRTDLETAWYKSQPEGWVYLREDILYCYKGEWPEGGVCEVPSNVKHIAGRAFRNSKFTEIILPDGIETLDVEVFAGVKNLTRVTIPESVTKIGSGAFNNCSGLQEIVIPSGVTEIGNSVFWGCSGLQEIVIPAGVTKIGSSAFNNCTGLREIIIPSGVTEIGDHAFSGCTGLTAITVPEGVSTIEKDTFSRCESLTEITLPQSIRTIDIVAFNACTNLHTINFSGTKQQWKNIEKNERWFINGVFTVYCTDGKLDQDGAIVP